MKFLVWNARGLRSSRAFQVLLHLKQVYTPNAMFLMEVKADNLLMERIRIKLGYASKLVVNNIGKNGGLCFLWSDLVDINLISFSNFHIVVKVISQQDVVWR
ncbi:hypothetical protein Ddye_016923 [Dipteronia dyeriana]|uniref:Uncharacterized protein n=1 Tax=Dipteronia dyeriana TaxID=168575 RepID=A0AAD9U885_9ROSI|nr:hypothetical protein Ddye_016923 [Dipteronia dyeriana]